MGVEDSVFVCGDEKSLAELKSTLTGPISTVMSKGFSDANEHGAFVQAIANLKEEARRDGGNFVYVTFKWADKVRGVAFGYNPWQVSLEGEVYVQRRN